MKSAFLDTNVILYCIDGREPQKQGLALDLITHLSDQASVSVQVLQEVYCGATRKLRLSPSEVREYLSVLGQKRIHQPGPQDVMRAIDTSERYRIHFWDAMIVESAAALRCDVLYTEDLNHGQSYRGVKVVNPFTK